MNTWKPIGTLFDSDDGFIVCQCADGAVVLGMKRGANVTIPPPPKGSPFTQYCWVEFPPQPLEEIKGEFEETEEKGDNEDA